MSSKRKLKKAVKNICGDLFADCVALSMCQPENDEKLKELMTMVMATYQDYVARLSHVETGQEKVFFKKLRSEFTQQANKLSDEIIKA